MLYRKMKKTGDELSILGFGCMRLPGKAQRIDEARAKKQVFSAIDRGVNYIDTAMPYHMGASEPFLGKILKGGYREKIKLATKLPPWSVKKPEDMDNLLNAQLKRLKTDRIDYYLLHSMMDDYWDMLEGYDVLEFLERAKKDGHIVNAGFSFHGDLETFKRIVDSYDWEFCQIQYNYLDEQYQAGTEGLKYAAAKDMGVVVMEPLRGGNLARKVPPAIQSVWDEAEQKRPPVEWALRWVWNHPEVTVVLSGMNIEEHIEENLRIADQAEPNTLTGHELELVGRVADTYRKMTKAACTGCRYCMPCPEGVDIPNCFEIYNHLHLFGDKLTANTFYITRLMGAFREEPSHPGLCKDCGKCVLKCPQNLPIPELLAEMKEEFNGRGLKAMAWVFKGILWFQRFRAIRSGGGRRSS